MVIPLMNKHYDDKAQLVCEVGFKIGEKFHYAMSLTLFGYEPIERNHKRAL